MVESSRGWKQPRVDSKVGEGLKRVGRYSFAVSAVVIYLKPLAVNISSSFIQRLGSFSRLQGCMYALLRSFLPSSESSRRPKDLFHVQPMFPAEPGADSATAEGWLRSCLPLLSFVYSGPLRNVRFKLRGG